MRAQDLLSIFKMKLITVFLLAFTPCITYSYSQKLINPSLELLTSKVVDKYPNNSRYARIYMRMNYSNIQRLQEVLDKCIKQKRSTEGCDNLISTNYGQDDNEPVKMLQIKKSSIIITPNTKLEPLSFLSESDTIIVTPIYKDGKVSWIYSGGLFEPRKKITTDELFNCPEPSALPNKIIDEQILSLNTSWLISVSATGKPVTDITNKDLQFVRANTYRLPKGKLACIYKIKTNRRPYFVTLYSQENLIKIPKQGLWSSESPGICVSLKVKDCPFRLKERFLKKKE